MVASRQIKRKKKETPLRDLPIFLLHRDLVHFLVQSNWRALKPFILAGLRVPDWVRNPDASLIMPTQKSRFFLCLCGFQPFSICGELKPKVVQLVQFCTNLIARFVQSSSKRLFNHFLAQFFLVAVKGIVLKSSSFVCVPHHFSHGVYVDSSVE